MKRVYWSLALIAALAVSPRASAQQIKGTTLPLELRLTARKSSCTLDLGGKTPEGFLRPLQELKLENKGLIPYHQADKFPPCPAVDLLLEIRNVGDREVVIWVGGHYSAPPTLAVRGPGVFAANCQSNLVIAPAPPPQPARKVTLKPGQNYSCPIRRLRDEVSFARPSGNRFYGTAPGEYTVTATWRLASGPKLSGGPTFTSNPVKLKVEAPQGTSKKGKMDPARLRGMKEAVADLEKGLLKVKRFYISIGQMAAPLWWGEYVSLLKKECGIALVYVDEARFPPPPHRDMDSYNAVMLLEIERRFGKGILDKLRDKAQANSRKGKDGDKQGSGPEEGIEKGKADPVRLRAMKEAVADLEKGHLKLKELSPQFGLVHAPAWHENYRKLLKRECGVDLLGVDLDEDRRSGGYNDVMVLEIEYRYGKGVLARLLKQARATSSGSKVCGKLGHGSKTTGQGEKGAADKGKADPARLRGMKAALKDIAAGFLKVKTVPPPAPPWWGDYVKLVKRKCGVEFVYVTDKELSSSRARAENAGYNAVMLLEIEHRFGKGILNRLGKKAREDYLKAEKGR